MTVAPLPAVFEIAVEDTSIDCRALWCAVLHQVIVDLITKSKKSSSYEYQARQEAIRWIGDRPSPNFSEVSWLAGFDPQVMHPLMRAMVDWPIERLRAVTSRNFKKAIEAVARDEQE